MREIDSCNKYAVIKVSLEKGNWDSVVNNLSDKIQHQEKEIYNGLNRIEELSIDTLKLRQQVTSKSKQVKGITLVGILLLGLVTTLFKTGTL